MKCDHYRLSSERDRNGIVCAICGERIEELTEVKDNIFRKRQAGETIQPDAAELWQEVKRLTAEIDRLAAQLTEAQARIENPAWTAITDDKRSYPTAGKLVVVRLDGGSEAIPARRDAIVDYHAEDGKSVTETETWFMERTGNLLAITPGDRWAYIPEAK